MLYFIQQWKSYARTYTYIGPLVSYWTTINNLDDKTLYFRTVTGNKFPISIIYKGPSSTGYIRVKNKTVSNFTECGIAFQKLSTSHVQDNPSRFQQSQPSLLSTFLVEALYAQEFPIILLGPTYFGPEQHKSTFIPTL